MKTKILIICFLCPILLFCQENQQNFLVNYDEIITNYKNLTLKQLSDTADYYRKNYSYDTALVYYNLIINSIPKNSDIEHQKILVKVYNTMSQIYISISDYRLAYDFLIKELLICEKYDLISEKLAPYANIGVIYFEMKQYELAKPYLLKALELSKDSASIIISLCNIGANELLQKKIDSGYYYVNKAFQISKQQNDFCIDYIFNNFGSYYQLINQYDSAFYYFHLSLNIAKKNNDIEVESISLTDIGKLYFELNKIDSALYYINLSNKIASENNFIKKLSDNYLILSEVEKSKGNFEKALNYYIEYNDLKDSIYNADVFGSINLMHSQYEVSKKNQQIEELVIDKQIRENTIRFQKIILNIILSAFTLVSLILIIVFYQKKKLNKSNKKLIEKNVEISNLYNSLSETKSETKTEIEIETKTETETKEVKSRKKILADNVQNELLSKISDVMKQTEIICKSEFSIHKLAELVHTNERYVSEVINTSLKKNFRSYINSFRIREAQRLLLNLDTTNFTVESIAPLVGFKSSKTFWEAFKEVTGVTPSNYLKSIKENIEK